MDIATAFSMTNSLSRSHAPVWECRLRLACLNVDPTTPSAWRLSGGEELVKSSSATPSHKGVAALEKHTFIDAIVEAREGVIPVKTVIQSWFDWIPAKAGMTKCILQQPH